MRLLTVDIADLKFSRDPDETLVTYALGSCIAVLAWDPRRKVAGMIHYMLPEAKTCPEKAREKPAMFADTGLPALFDGLGRLGSSPRELVLKVAGGAKRYEVDSTFDIGKRNYLMLRKLLWKSGLLIAAEDVGGTRSRTVRLQVGSGAVTIRSEGEEWPL
jgi:chemotaxis protein CheD